jgi:hypothetical protein
VTEDVHKHYRRAVADLRRNVEVLGRDWNDALGDVLVNHTLGLCQIAELQREASKRYSK